MTPSCEQVATFLFLMLIVDLLLSVLFMPTSFIIINHYKRKVKNLETDVAHLSKVIEYQSELGDSK